MIATSGQLEMCAMIEVNIHEETAVSANSGIVYGVFHAAHDSVGDR